MDEQEAVRRIVAMGFEEMAAHYNTVYYTDYAYVFFHPSEGQNGLWCFCEEGQNIFNLLHFLEVQCLLGRFESGCKTGRAEGGM